MPLLLATVVSVDPLHERLQHAGRRRVEEAVAGAPGEPGTADRDSA